MTEINIRNFFTFSQHFLLTKVKGLTVNVSATIPVLSYNPGVPLIKSSFCPTCSDAVDSVTSLYNHVEEQAHVLVQRSNMSLEHLEYLLQLREMEGHFLQVQGNRSTSATCFKIYQA